MIRTEAALHSVFIVVTIQYFEPSFRIQFKFSRSDFCRTLTV